MYIYISFLQVMPKIYCKKILLPFKTLARQGIQLRKKKLLTSPKGKKSDVSSLKIPYLSAISAAHFPVTFPA
jgi:hypothetical protein